jgi:hypothetical protein
VAAIIFDEVENCPKLYVFNAKQVEVEIQLPSGEVTN